MTRPMTRPMTLRARIIIAYACDPIGAVVRGMTYGAFTVGALAMVIRGCN